MAEGRESRGRGRWWFLGSMICAYGLLWMGEPQAAGRAIGVFFGVLGQVVPVLLFVFLLLFLVDLFMDERRVRHYLGTQSGLKGWLVVLLGGVLSMGPIYPWYAMLAEMRGKGMSNALIATFLYSRALKLPLLPLMAHYFGIAYTVMFAFYLLLFSVINGILVARLTRHGGGVRGKKQ